MIVVVGAGHNGLVAACYLARAGRDVLVLEALDRPGGGARTEERIPGYRFDLHSVAHNIINMTSIPAELDLAGAGLEYMQMDPFSIAVHADGRRVRFHRSVDATVDSIAEVDRAEADAYRGFIDAAVPIVRAVLPTIRGERDIRGRFGGIARALRQQPLTTMRDVLGPYDALLRRRLVSDLTRGPVAAFAAHGGVGPTTPGGALFAYWQAAYHLFGQWHARGGAQGLTDALVTRLRALGGQLRCGARVERIETVSGRVSAVVVEGGERLGVEAVVTAVDPKVALLELLQPPLEGAASRDLSAARRGNVVQAVIHVATSALPPYPDSRPGDWNGLQSFVDRVGDLSRAWSQAEAFRLPDAVPLYAFTSSAIDATLAPPGHHTVYLACPAAPARIVEGRWDEFVERSLETVERHAPGFRNTITAVAPWTPDRMDNPYPMHLDIALDQLGPFRPTRTLAGHRTPVEGLFISGAGTSPTGGIAGTPGRLAAQAVLRQIHPRSARAARNRP